MEICTPTLVVRITQSPDVVRAVQKFRAEVFDTDDTPTDADKFDSMCRHIVVKNVVTGRLVGCLRVMELADGQALSNCYASQFYDLKRLSSLKDPFLELGRFYVAPSVHSANVIRLIWAMVAQLVDLNGAKILFGCTSFAGTDVGPHRNSFQRLAAQYLGPECWRPGPKSVDTVRLATEGNTTGAQLPALLRSYLGMGGWVSDHAVIDHALSTIHVFTALEVRNIPARRAARLRQIAA